FYVDEDGAHTCSKQELPINNGGVKPTISVATTPVTTPKTTQTFSPWGNNVPQTSVKEEEFVPVQEATPIEMVLPKICFCWNDMDTVDADFSCDNLDMLDQAGEMCCMNCAHADMVYVRKR
ncbi:MAG: hypothetical protein WC936_07160, partial [Candidatus Nanoarchaeia archaeon]